jgi:hypothetical protein
MARTLIKHLKKKYLKDCEDEDENEAEDYIKGDFNKYNMCIHTAYTSDYEKMKLKKVNEYWTSKDGVCYSPTIGPGINYDTEHFDEMFCILSKGSCSPRYFMQMCGRVRKLKSNVIYVFTNGFKLPKTKSRGLFTYEEVYGTHIKRHGKKIRFWKRSGP